MKRQADIVVVMGRERIKNDADGPIIHRRFTNFWVPENNSWRLLASHANVIAS